MTRIAEQSAWHAVKLGHREVIVCKYIVYIFDLHHVKWNYMYTVQASLYHCEFEQTTLVAGAHDNIVQMQSNVELKILLIK